MASTHTKNQKLIKFVNEFVARCRPRDVYWCNGSQDESDRILHQLVKAKKTIRLNQKKRPGCYLFRSDPRDVYRNEKQTYICSADPNYPGPTNNWCDPNEMREKMYELYNGCMEGRTMYVIPFSMGPIGSKIARYGVEITDSPYVAVCMRILCRVGQAVLDQLGESGDFARCVHSVGYPVPRGYGDVVWPCDPDRACCATFPATGEIWSFGSGYGDLSFLSKKCFSLRLGSAMAEREGWLAEHMVLFGVNDPRGRKTYMAATFPAGCGKTNLSMLVPPAEMAEKGWSVTTLGDDITWLRPDEEDGKLHAINPETGFFGVAPGTCREVNPNEFACCSSNTIFTNVALTDDGDVWWEGMTEEPPRHCKDWIGKDWWPGCGRIAAHPNSRYVAPSSNCPSLDPEWDNPEGVPVSAFLYGGSRMRNTPLVMEARNWRHGVYLGGCIGSEYVHNGGHFTRRDPYAMLPFCGYSMSNYMRHLLKIGREIRYPPRVYQVNWFRKTRQGAFMWPGFRQNMRVLAWIVGRVHCQYAADEVPFGYVPMYEDFDLDGLQFTRTDFEMVMHVDINRILEQCHSNNYFFNNALKNPPPEIIAVSSDILSRCFY